MLTSEKIKSIIKYAFYFVLTCFPPLLIWQGVEVYKEVRLKEIQINKEIRLAELKVEREVRLTEAKRGCWSAIPLHPYMVQLHNTCTGEWSLKISAERKKVWKSLKIKRSQEKVLR